MKPCFSCIHISAGPSDSSSDPALRIPALSKCRRIRFRHWEAGLSAECRGTRRLNSTTATTSESSGVRTADRNKEGTVCLSPGRRCSKVLIGALAITSERRTTMEAHCQHRFWGNARKCLVLAGTLAAAVTLVSPGGLEAASPSTDAIQTQISAHDAAQPPQHDALSQQIANISTGGGDLSGLPPTWDKVLSADNPLDPCSSSRFKCVMGGEAVRDNETGLVWEKEPSPTLQLWQNARGFCATKTVGGRKGWRLSSIEELASLIDPSVPSPGPALPPGHPFLNVQSDAYWAATADATVSTNAWGGDFLDGSVHAFTKTFTLLVWCVRGDGPLSQY